MSLLGGTCSPGVGTAGSDGCPSPAACKLKKRPVAANRGGHFRVREAKKRKGHVVVLRQAFANARRSLRAGRMDTGLWCLGIGFVIIWRGGGGGELIKKKQTKNKQERGNHVD